MARTRPAFCPTHPGSLLKHDVLPALGLTVKDAAFTLGVSRQALHAVMRHGEPAAVSPDMAVRLGKLCGWRSALAQYASAYDLWHAERKIDVSAIPTLRRARSSG